MRLLLFFSFLVSLLSPPPIARADLPAPPLSPHSSVLSTSLPALLQKTGPDRSAASPGSRITADHFAARLTALTAQPVHRQRFLMVLPQVEFCDATPLPTATPVSAIDPSTLNIDSSFVASSFVASPLVIPLFPLLPAAAQPAAFPQKNATAPLIYAGRGTLAELAGKTIANNFVALDVTCDPAAWQTVASLGAKAVIFLGSPNATVQSFFDKNPSVPLALPRFYMDDPAAVAAVRAGKIPALNIRVHITWQEKEVDNLLCLIPGRQTTANLPFATAKRGGPWTDQLIVIQARYDSSSQVMTRAPAAEQAAWPAIATELAQKIAAAPDHCSVLILLTVGDEWQFRGTRSFLDMLRPDLKDPKKSLENLQKSLSNLDQSITNLTAISKNLGLISSNLPSPTPATTALFSDKILARILRDQLERSASHLEEQLERARLAEDSATRATLEARKLALTNAASALLGHRDIASSLPTITAAAAEVLPIWQRELARVTRERDARRTWLAARKIIGERNPLLHLEIAFTSHGERFGAFARSGYFTQLDQTGKMSDFAQGLRRYWVDAYGKTPPAAATFDADAATGQYPLNTFFPIRRAFSTDAVLLRGQPALALATIRDASGIVDTPNDTADRINFPALAAQAADLETILLGTAKTSGVLTDPRFYGRSEIASAVTDQPVRLLERTLGETTPRLAAAEILVGGEHEKDSAKQNNPGPLQGTRRFDWYFSHPFAGVDDADVSITMNSLLRHEFRLHAMDFDADGLPTRTVVQNTNEQKGIVHAFTPDANRPQRAMLFDCTRLSLYGLFDPRYMEYLDKLELLDSRRLDKAQFTNTYVRDGVAAVFFPDDLRWQLLVSKGDVTNRMVVINADTAAKGAAVGRGFATTDLTEIGPLPWRTATDLYALNSRRKANLEMYGITNQIVTDLHGRAKEFLDAGEKARAEKDYAGWMASAAAAWSLEEQVYAAVIGTSNGIIKGVIFLLLGVIPFSYFLERLVIGATNVYKQIGWFALIFALMTLALFGHPAFRISAAPLMILLAFLILILSSTVIYILWEKFEEEIARLRGAGSAAHSTSLRRGAVFGAAVRLGLSNMRRRGMRTTLTLITLVLLTFTLLCFTSVSESLQLTPRVVAEAPAKSPPGILLRLRAWKTLPAAALQTAREIAGPGGVISERWWYASERPEQRFVLPISQENAAGAGERVFSATGLVGIDGHEGIFQAHDIGKLLPGFARLEAGEAVCFLPEDVKVQGFVVGGKVRVLGELLEVAGFFDPDKVQMQLRHLTGDELMPTDPSSSAAAPGVTQSTAPEELAALPEVGYRYVSPRAVALVPVEVARRLGGRLTSVMILPGGMTNDKATNDEPNSKSEIRMTETGTGLGARGKVSGLRPLGILLADNRGLPATATQGDGPSGQAQVPARGDDMGARVAAAGEGLARRAAFTVFVSDGAGVRSLNSVESTQPQNLDKVLVPLLIAGVIVLNTMLGAVAERTKEIHVYTSVGLAPSHVGMLFLAEAAALGTLGVVFGYIFGQLLATLLSHTGWISGVDLNYSSMAAIFTMGLVVALVMLSSLWPARAATRVAAPSLQRDWKLPPAEGDFLHVELPFTVNQTAAKGVCAFIEEFLTSASQAGTGRFTADHVRAFEVPDGGARGISCRVWLAPYDLGVIEKFWLAIHATDDSHVFEVRLTLQREAGNPATWYRLNRPFLVEVRKQFLLWRAVRAEMVAEYVARSRRNVAAGGKRGRRRRW